MPTYATRVGRITTTKPVTVGQLAALVKAKAKGDAMTPVYDENGKLVGMIDPANLLPITPAAGGSKTTTVGSKAGVPVNELDVPAAAAAQQAAADVTKALRGATFQDSSPVVNFAKSAFSIADRYGALLKALDPEHANALNNSVAVAALRIMNGGGSDSAAVRVAKSIALDIADREARKPTVRPKGLNEGVALFGRLAK